MDGLLRDVRHATRHLVRSPGFAIVTILTLALGIGANTAIFSVVNVVILQPLRYPQPDRLVYISSQFPQLGFDQFWISPPEFLEFQERTRTFSAVGAFASGQANLTTPDQPRRVNAVQASAELFNVLGVNALYGRTFETAETRPNGALVTILSYELWKSAFGGSPSAIGSQVEVNGVRRTVVGIMPPKFDVADLHVEIWNPLVVNPANRQNRGSHFLYLIGRLADGATLQTAKAELDTLLAGWSSSIARAAAATNGPHTPDPKNHRLRFDPLQAQIVGSAKTAVLVLQGAVVFVLLIACANLANLLLARAESRHKEFAVRAALGAGRARLLGQFVVEGCLLSLAGATLGLGVAVFGLRALIAAYPDSLPRSADITLDLGVLVFTLLVALATGAIFGLAPLLHLAPDATSSALKEGGTRSTAGAGRNRVRRALVAAEVALAVALVIGAGLLLRTVMNLSSVDAGFNRGQLVTFAITLPNAKYSQPEQVRTFYTRLLDQLRATPGVQSVASMTGLPPLRNVNANDTNIEGYTPPPEGPFANVDYYNTVTTGYVETMGIPVVEGRAFQPADALGTTVLINQAMARTFYKDQSPIGRRVRPSAPASLNVPWFTIVGVLKDVKQGGVDKAAGTELYFDVEQLTRVNTGYGIGTMNVVLRTTLPADALSGTIRAAVAGFDPSLPIVKLRSVDDVFAESIGRPRLLAQLLGIFAGLAILLAAIGSYGVLAYMVAERRREIGIRMALGADRGSVQRMILAQGLGLTLAGVVGGLAVAFAMNRVLASLLFGVRPSDPATIGGVVALIAAVALVACYLPARSATRVDPMIVLREE
jgi:putative ABC transport system permease protein